MAAKPVKIPFDSFCLASVVAELQEYVGGKIQGIRQPTDTEVSVGLYASGREAMLFLSCHPLFARAHLVTRRPPNQPEPPGFLQALRARVDGAQVVQVRQVGFDRILEVVTQGQKGRHTLIAELMGKHANLILVGEDDRVVSSAKAIGRSKSSRPILSGMPYVRPPFPPRPSLLEAREGDDLRQYEGASPFLLRLMELDPSLNLTEVQRRVQHGEYDPVIAPGHGAYPVSVAALGLPEHDRGSTSVALEQHFESAVRENETETLRQSLAGQLRRVVLAREVALTDLRQALEAGEKAGRWQLFGELILAYGSGIQEGQKVLQAWDYEGSEVKIPLDPELDWKANANRFFERAKKAKGRMGLVRDQIERLSKDRDEIQEILRKVEEEPRLDRLRDLQEEAKNRRWLNIQRTPTKTKEERPFEGNRVRELVGPQGFAILYGENAESNDYLTLRVAKPNDLWLHVRGHISAHVVIPTRNQPDKVSRETLMFAAKVAVQNSPAKHSGYVPVDYTLKKYVRKPKGAPKGTALYTHEKTLHVEG